MADTTYSNFTTPAVDAEWLNDTNRLVYQLAGNAGAAPLNDSDVKTNLGITADIAAGDAATLASATALPGRLIGVQRFTANGTYTPTAGTTSIVVEALGGGGAGGGCPASTAGNVASGSGGAAGGYTVGRFTSGFSGQAVTIGTAGIPVAGGTGGSGGTTSLGGLITANGGGGGNASGNAAVTAAALATAAAPSGTGGNIYAIGGPSPGTNLNRFSDTVGLGGNGADSRYGLGGRNNTSPTFYNGSAASGNGAGGAGGMSFGAGTITAGGAGTAGLLVIWEYS